MSILYIDTYYSPLTLERAKSSFLECRQNYGLSGCLLNNLVGAVALTIANTLEALIHAVCSAVILGGLFIPALLADLCASEEGCLREFAKCCNFVQGVKHLIVAIGVAVQTPLVLLGTFLNGIAASPIFFKFTTSQREYFYRSLNDSLSLTGIEQRDLPPISEHLALDSLVGPEDVLKLENSLQGHSNEILRKNEYYATLISWINQGVNPFDLQLSNSDLSCVLPHVTSLEINDEYFSLSQETLERIIASCRELTVLTIRSANLEKIPNFSHLNNLTSLEISGNWQKVDISELGAIHTLSSVTFNYIFVPYENRGVANGIPLFSTSVFKYTY